MSVIMNLLTYKDENKKIIINQFNEYQKFLMN